MGLLFLERTEKGGGTGQLLCLGVSTQLHADCGRRTLTIVKVEAVEVHPLHQVAEALGLKRGQARVADLPVGRRTRASWQKSNGCRPKFVCFTFPQQVDHAAEDGEVEN